MFLSSFLTFYSSSSLFHYLLCCLPFHTHTRPFPPSLSSDVCCGTGTIGLCVADAADSIVGVDIEPAAIADAVRNAELNGCAERCRFVAGKAEDCLKTELQSITGDVVAIVDPPRSGLRLFF